MTARDHANAILDTMREMLRQVPDAERPAATEHILSTCAKAHTRLHKPCSHATTYPTEGGDPGVCKGPNCGAAIIWIKTAAGRKMPLNENGAPHHSTCPDAAFFRDIVAGRCE